MASNFFSGLQNKLANDLNTSKVPSQYQFNNLNSNAGAVPEQYKFDNINMYICPLCNNKLSYRFLL